MDAETYLALIAFSCIYMVLKIRLTGMKIRHNLYEKGSINDHADALSVVLAYESQ